MAKQAISRNEYLQLLGLLTAAKKHERLIEELGIVATDIIEPERKDKSRMNDYIADQIYGNGNPNALTAF